VIFGTRSSSFSTKGEAIYSTLLLALGFALDEFNEDLVVVEGGALGTIWLTLLAVTFPVVLLGAFFAGLFDAYMEAKVDSRRYCQTSMLKQVQNAFLNMDAFLYRTKQLRRLQALAEERSPLPVAPQPLPAAAQPDGRAGPKPADPAAKRTTELHQAWARWSEAFLLDVLLSCKQERDSDSSVVDVRRLVEEVQQRLPAVKIQEADRFALEALLERAAAAASTEQASSAKPWPCEAASQEAVADVCLPGAVRLCSRADANVRELSSLVQGVEAKLRQREEERAAKAKRGDYIDDNDLAAPYDKMKVEDIDFEIMHARAPLQTESPEPEPRPVSSGTAAAVATEMSTNVTFDPQAANAVEVAQKAAVSANQRAQRAKEAESALDSLVEENLRNVSDAQAQRHQQLSDSMERLAQRLEPFLQAPGTAEGLATTISLDPERLKQLDAQVRLISQKLAPILDADAVLAQPGVVNVPKGW